jgi:hypothetical protein
VTTEATPHTETRETARRQLTQTGRFGVALAVSILVTMIWAAPLLMHLNSRVLGNPSDATSTIRDYWYYQHIGKTPFNARLDAFISAPEGVKLSPSVQVANAFQPAVIWGLKDVVGLVAAWNLFILAGIALSAACAWLFLDLLGIGALPAAFGAYAFGFSGYLVNSAFAGHGGLVHAWIFPLLIIALLRARARRSLWSAAVPGALVGLAFYIHSYYGFFAAFVVGVFCAIDAIEARDNGGWRAPLKRLGIAIAATVAALIPAAVAIFTMGNGTGEGGHSTAALQQFGARLPSYVTPSEWSPLGHLVPKVLQDHVESSGEPSLFIGFSTIAIALVYVLRYRRRDPGDRRLQFVSLFLIGLTAAALVMSLPRLFAIGPIHVPAPSWFIGHVSTVWRVYARYGVLVGLGLASLAAFGVSRIQRVHGTRWAAACLLVLVLELTPSLPPKTWATNDIPAADRWLADHPGGIAAIYPLAGDQAAAAYLNGREYYFQRLQGHPLYSAIGASTDQRALALRVLTQYFRNSDTARVLAAEHVRYVVIRDDVYREMHQKPPVLSKNDFKQVARVQDARIFTVTAKPLDLRRFLDANWPAAAAAMGLKAPKDHFGSGFFAPENFKFATPWRWMSQDAKITIKPSDDQYVVFETLAFSNGASRVLQLFGPYGQLIGQAYLTTSMSEVKIGPFFARAGSQTYTLKATPGPTPLSDSDPRVTSIYLNEPVFRSSLPPNP